MLKCHYLSNIYHRRALNSRYPLNLAAITQHTTTTSLTLVQKANCMSSINGISKDLTTLFPYRHIRRLTSHGIMGLFSETPRLGISRAKQLQEALKRNLNFNGTK